LDLERGTYLSLSSREAKAKNLNSLESNNLGKNGKGKCFLSQVEGSLREVVSKARREQNLDSFVKALLPHLLKGRKPCIRVGWD